MKESVKKIVMEIIRALATIATLIPIGIVFKAAATAWLTIISGFAFAYVIYIYFKGFDRRPDKSEADYWKKIPDKDDVD